MLGIEVLVEEHENIKRMAKVMRIASLKVMEGEELVTKDFYTMLQFVRNYADKHHHGKEEKVLFEFMKQELGKVAQTLITHGMLVEHDLGRFHMMKLEEALKEYEDKQSSEAKLDIIVNTTAYTDLINRHIDKENEVVFTFGEKNLSKESKDAVDRQTKEFEESANKEGIQNHYLEQLKKLEEKYLG